jgi:hypothetical protein
VFLSLKIGSSPFLKKRTKKLLFVGLRGGLLAAAVVTLVGCTQVPKCPSVPADQADDGHAPPQPASRKKLVLAPGHWEWNGDSYDWVAPAWVPRPNQHAEKSGRIWQRGTWQESGVACVWVPAHFLF